MNNYFTSSETILEYNTIDEALKDIKNYIEYDDTYNKYLLKQKEKFDDAEIYCINHILALKKVLEEFKIIKKEMEKMNNDKDNNKKKI